MKRNRVLASLAGLVFAAMLPSAVYGQLVQNGNFTSNGGNGQLGSNTSATDWSVPAPSGSYAFLFNPDSGSPSGSSADIYGSTSGEYGTLALYGPGNGNNNGFTQSPLGGAIVGMDSAFQVGALSQTINGLTPNQTYALSFYWAAAQQYPFSGATSSQWQVSFGSQTQTTAFANIPTGGFSGWQSQTFDFTASSSSEVLSFLANGSPQVPPFALLANVSLQAVPETGSGVAVLAGVACFGLFARRRARSKK